MDNIDYFKNLADSDIGGLLTPETKKALQTLAAMHKELTDAGVSDKSATEMINETLRIGRKE